MCTGPVNVNMSGGASQTKKPKRFCAPFVVVEHASMHDEQLKMSQSQCVKLYVCVNVYCDDVVGFFAVASCVCVACTLCTVVNSAF